MPQLRRLRFISLHNRRRALPRHTMNHLPRITTLNVLRINTTHSRNSLRVNRQNANRRAGILFFFRVNRRRALPILIRRLFTTINHGLRPTTTKREFRLRISFNVITRQLVITRTLSNLNSHLLVWGTTKTRTRLRPVTLYRRTPRRLRLSLTRRLSISLTRHLIPSSIRLKFLFFRPIRLTRNDISINPLQRGRLVTRRQLRSQRITIPLYTRPLTKTNFNRTNSNTSLPQPSTLNRHVPNAKVGTRLINLFNPKLPIRFTNRLNLSLRFTTNRTRPNRPNSLLVLQSLRRPYARDFRHKDQTNRTIRPNRGLIRALRPRHYTRPT